MKLIAKVKLQPTESQYQALRCTVEIANAASNYLSNRVWETRTYGQFALHKLAYHETRKLFPLSAQIVVRCIARVANAYKLDKRVTRKFRPLSAIPFDDRILRWNCDKHYISIWTVDGRQRIPFVCGDVQEQLLKSRQGQSDLIYHDNEFYLHAICEVEEMSETNVVDFMGLDLGVKNIVATSDGKIYASSHLNNVRHRRRHLRAELQSRQTKSANRKLKRLSGKESRFSRDVNHCISKEIVAEAQRTGRGIALENLKGIRGRIRASRSQRATLHSWAFSQLRKFISYKARLAGIPVVLVNPATTSQRCPTCGFTDRRNRISQANFLCKSCGFAGHADIVAAENIRRAAINQPIVSAI